MLGQMEIKRSISWKAYLALLGLSLVGLLGIIPYVLTLQSAQLAEMELPMPIELVLVVQTATNLVLVSILALVGYWLATRIGLGLPLLEQAFQGKPVGNMLRRVLPLSIGVGVAGALIVIALDAGVFGPGWSARVAMLGEAAESISPPAWQGFLASFYGGVVEEVQLRLFFFSLLAWLGSHIWRTGEGYPTKAVLWSSAIIAAVAFGLGHLPTVATMGITIDTFVVTRIVLLNGLLGIALAWLYWTHGFESAMIAHFSADIVLHVLLPLLGVLIEA